MKNIKIRTKLLLAFAFVIISAALVGVYMLVGIQHIEGSYNQAIDLTKQRMEHIFKIKDHLAMARLHWREAFYPENTRNELTRLASEFKAELDTLEIEINAFHEIAAQGVKNDLDKVLPLVKQYKKEGEIVFGTLLAVNDISITNPDYQTAMIHAQDIMINAVNTYLSQMVEVLNHIPDKALGVLQSLKEQNSAKAESVLNFSLLISALVALLSTAIALYIATLVSRPLKNIVEVLKQGEDGDMRARSSINQQDEIGILAHSINNFFEKIQGILRGLHENSDTLAGASEELSAVSRELASGAEEMVNQSNSVASTTEQMAVNINSMASGAEEASVNANDVASAAEQMSTNMNTIASAVEEMSASISEIASNTSEVRHIAEDATSKSSDATNAMNKLGIAAKEIGQVTDVIKKIADKTNLLALNATIEAASAGEAGKGFAVVASEIKELANQSAISADDIARRIDGIQNGTNDAVEVIVGVSDIIVKINQSVEAIAGHVEQQTKASNEIANNVAQANIGARRVAGAITEVAKGAHDVSHNAAEAATGATHVSSNVTGMSQVAKESSHGASQVSQAAGDLSRVAETLNQTVKLFKV